MIQIISAKSTKRPIFQQFESANLWSQFTPATLKFTSCYSGYRNQRVDVPSVRSPLMNKDRMRSREWLANSGS